MTVNFNVEPYFDDYDESKGYHRILFKPGVAVQARELTQLQTILQKQIERFGRHIFKEGSMVIPGQLSIDINVNAVKLEATTLNLETVFASGNVIVTGSTSGVTASIIKGISAEGLDPPTLIVRFLTAGSNNSTRTFTDGETLTITGSSSTLTTIASDAVTNSSIAAIETGVYFVLNNFVIIDTQTIVLDKYSRLPSYRIGLAVTEDFSTEEDDPTLKDNAQGSYNENAPGAHRYKIALSLDKLSLTSTLDQDYIELSRIENGVVQNLVNRTEYSFLEKTLARRTFDESGNYTVKPFRIQIREHRNNNRGLWASGKANIIIGDIISANGNTYVSLTTGTTGSTQPTHIAGSATDGTISWLYVEKPIYNQGVFNADAGGSEDKLAIGIEPGKAYVQGYEIEKISTQYLAVNKARSTSAVTNDIISTLVGNYVKISNVFSNSTVTLGITNFGTVNLYDAFTVTRGAVTSNVIGTARVRDLTYDSGNAASTDGVFKLSIFDINMNTGKSFVRNVKQIGNVANVASGVSFTADISPEYIQLSGTITATASTSVVGSGTKFTTELSIGDWIYFNNPSVGRRKVVGITDDYSLTVDNSATITASIPYRIESQLYEPESQSLLYELPYSAIKETSGPSYTTTKTVEATSTGVGVISISGDTYNASALAADYVVINRTTGAIVNPSSIVTTSSTITIDGVTPSNDFTIVIPVVKTAAPKTKTPTIASLTITNASIFSQPSISLNKADVYKIDSVKMQGNTIDITDWFSLDNGQKTTQYDVSRLIRNPNYPSPTSNVTVQFRYFAHGSGDYFSANSYSTVQRTDVPIFYSDTFSVRLTDVLDFRPRKDDTNINFTGTGSSDTDLPRRGFQTNISYQFYLPRKDKIVLDPNGNLFVLTGASALVASEENDPILGMTLYKVDLSAYTTTPSTPDVTFTYIDNKRYTMRDIGILEKRLNQVEYYTALNLLEQETKSLTILDGEGLDRFKNGFIVDNFEGHGVGDVYAPDYRCSVDMQKNQLRPFYYMNNINLVEENNTDVGRIAGKYQVTGDLVTLRYSSTPLIIQPYASRTENVNPFSVAYFNGRFTLTPSADEWFETKRNPDVVINDDGNFDSLKALTEGSLGTVWNAWETQWVGTPQIELIDLGRQVISPNETTSLTLQRETSQIGQARTGVRTSVVAKVDSRNVGDRVVSIVAIPFIRSRDVMFLARGMKPNSNVYSFFDSVPVSPFVTPAAKASLTSISGSFDYITNADTYDTPSARDRRRKAGDPEAAFNRGDVVYIYNSGAYTLATSNGSAVVSFVENSSSGNILHLVNLQGELKAGNQIKGSISEATATLVSDVTTPAQGTTLVTNVNGDIAGVFDIPNADSIRFRTGTKEFRLTDSPTNASTFTTRARANYTASGILETKESTILSTRTAEVVQEAITDQQVVVQTNETIISNRNFREVVEVPVIVEVPVPVEVPIFIGIDSFVDDDDDGDGDEPLAQTFVIDQRGGCFLTKVDLFFSNKDEDIPVKIEIRDVVNGYPGKRILPFSRVFKYPNEIPVSEDGTVPTTFTFDSPVYLQDGIEYAIVILTDSFNYRVWISQVGETMVGTDRIISGQPALGSLFKSQNASTWSADQLQDLKFTLYRAVFDTANTDATISFLNEKVSSVTLSTNPLKLTNGSNVVTVTHVDHGLVSGSNVTISGFSTQSGIHSTDINKSHTVGNVLINSYTVSVGNTATTTSFVGGTNIIASENKIFSTMHPIIQYQTFTETAVNFNAFSTDSTLAATRSATGVNITPNRNNYFTSEKVIKSDDNQGGTNASNKSLKISAIMTSSNDSVSPVIDLNRSSVILVKNSIDNIDAANVNFLYTYRTVVSGNNTISFSGNTISTTNGTTANLLGTIGVGRTISIAGAGSSTNNATVVVSSVTNQSGIANITTYSSFVTESTGNAITIVARENFVDERASRNGSAAAKYITRQLNLKNPSKYLRVMLSATIPQQADIDVYYKTGTANLFDTNWIKFDSSLSPIVKTQDQTYFTDVEYEIDDLPAFTTVAIKLVFRSTTTAWVPLIKDLRIIACP